MSDENKPKYHCPMDRIAQESTADLPIDERFFVDAFEATMAWVERAFETDASKLSETVRAKMFLHVVEHAQAKISRRFAEAFRHSAKIFGVSEEAIDRAIQVDALGDLMGVLFNARPATPPTIDPSKMEA